MSTDHILPAGAVLPPMPGPGAATPGDEATAALATTGVTVPKKTVAAASVPGLARDPTAKPQPRGRRARPVEAPQHPDRFRVLNDFVDGQMRDVGDAAAKAWFVLYRDTKPDGLVRTGLSDMAIRMGCAVSTAKRAARELKARGLVTLVQKGAPGRGPNVYRVHGKPSPGSGRGGDDPGPSCLGIGVSGDPQ
ncbi:MAG: hypothetical protein K8S94_01850 [Planctomycetia bacterium]|nr:hypothetical protein [Planctomycetia bacterium]